MYRISFDGSIFDERGYAVIGGRAEALQLYLKDRYKNGAPDLKAALMLCIGSLENVTNQRLSPEGLEVAALDRTRVGRKFRRIPVAESHQILG
jgi:proteasome alpha subunit